MNALVGLLALTYLGDDPASKDRRAIVSARDDLDFARLVAVEATTRQTEYLPLEPIRVSIRATNNAGADLMVRGCRSAYGRMVVAVYDSSGKPVPKTRFGESAGADSRTRESGAPRYLDQEKSIAEEVVANLARDMTATGEYSIVIGMTVIDPRTLVTMVAHSEILKVRVAGEPISDGSPARRATDDPSPSGR